MKLNYLDTNEIADSTQIILKKKAHRIELYLKQRDPTTWCLVALSGTDESLPEKSKLQGPFHSLSQCAGAASAIVSTLLRSNYEITDSNSIWSIQAQSLTRTLRSELAESGGNYDFDPNDVYF